MRHFKKWTHGLLLVSVLLAFASCSSDPETEPDSNPNTESNPEEIELAPNSVARKSFRFYGYDNEEYDFKYKVVAAEDPLDAKIYMQSEYIIISAPSFYYEKTDKNNANVSCMFHYDILGIIGYAQIFDYQLNLTFLTPNYGTYEGKLTRYESSDDWILVKGVFAYNSDKDIEELAKEVEDSEDGESENENTEEPMPENTKYEISNPIVEDITSNSAIVKGKISGVGVTFQERGVCYSMNVNPTIKDNVVKSNIDDLNCLISGLAEETTYYCRLYAIVDSDVKYGNQTTFETLPVVTISRPTFSSISAHYATVNGKISANGSNITEAGIVYSTSQMPTIDNEKIVISGTNINYTLYELKSSTTYYIRLYVKIDAEIYYSEQGEFTTYDELLTNFKPYVISNEHIMLRSTAPKGYNSVDICWGTYNNPQITNNATTLIPTNGKLTLELSNLNSLYTYYVRSYKKTGSNIEYSDDIVSVMPVHISSSAHSTKAGQPSFLIYRSSSYSERYYRISYKNLPEGTYKIGGYNKFESTSTGNYRMQLSTNNQQFDTEIYISGTNGTFYCKSDMTFTYHALNLDKTDNQIQYQLKFKCNI